MPNINFNSPQFKDQKLNDSIINLSTFIISDDFNKNVLADKLKSLYKALREVNPLHVVTDFSDYLKFLISEIELQNNIKRQVRIHNGYGF